MSNRNWQDISSNDAVIVLGLTAIFFGLFFLAKTISL